MLLRITARTMELGLGSVPALVHQARRPESQNCRPTRPDPGLSRPVGVSGGVSEPASQPCPKGALAIVLGWEEGAARCQVGDAQAAPTDPGECARNRRSDDDTAGSWKGESRLQLRRQHTDVSSPDLIPFGPVLDFTAHRLSLLSATSTSTQGPILRFASFQRCSLDHRSRRQDPSASYKAHPVPRRRRSRNRAER